MDYKNKKLTLTDKMKIEARYLNKLNEFKTKSYLYFKTRC